MNNSTHMSIMYVCIENVIMKGGWRASKQLRFPTHYFQLKFNENTEGTHQINKKVSDCEMPVTSTPIVL